MKTKFSIISLLSLSILMLTACGEKTGTDGEVFDPQGLTSPPTPQFANILLYATDNIHLGNLGGRAGADIICDLEKPAEVADRQIRAFISIEDGDGIQDMPANYGVDSNEPVVSLSGMELATDWVDFTDGSIAFPLRQALDNIPLNTYYWTGTMADGTANVGCDGFTSNSGGGDAGSGDENDGQWLSAVGSVCGFGRQVLCIAY